MDPGNLVAYSTYYIEYDGEQYEASYQGETRSPLGGPIYHFSCPARLFYLTEDQVEEFVDYLDAEQLDLTPRGCSHDWVNVGFFTLTMACKHCGCDQPPPTPSRITLPGDLVLNIPPPTSIVYGSSIVSRLVPLPPGAVPYPAVKP